ncbi:hypothetical protein [Streptomyces venezuelae]|uniref:hypothetical protein n=1 Tax=Streptomyces venezuelae TaxID=54571 RepID=UPI001680520E|nr:hypothetical protein [Streptomyces venezuelae]
MATGADEEANRQAWARDMVRGLPPMDQEDVEDLECLRDLLHGDSAVTDEEREESA